MVYFQKITPPPNKVLDFSLTNFKGGLNNHSDQLKDNEASDLLNMSFVDDTLMEKRKGQKYFSTMDLLELPSGVKDEFHVNMDTNFMEKIQNIDVIDLKDANYYGVDQSFSTDNYFAVLMSVSGSASNAPSDFVLANYPNNIVTSSSGFIDVDDKIVFLLPNTFFYIKIPKSEIWGENIDEFKAKHWLEVDDVSLTYKLSEPIVTELPILHGGSNIEFKSVPSGVSDEITNDGDYIRNVSDDYTIQESDIAGIYFYYHVDIVTVNISGMTDMIGYGKQDLVATKLFTSKTTPLDADHTTNLYSVNSEWKHCITVNNELLIIVPKDTYEDAYSAKAGLAGETIRYQLAEPIVSNLSVSFIDEFKPYQGEDMLLKATESTMYIGDEVLTDLQGKPNGVNHNGMYIFADGDSLYTYAKLHQEESTYRKVLGTPVDDYMLFEIISPPDEHAQLGTEHVEGVLVADYDNAVVYYEPCENEFSDTYKGANVVPNSVKYIVSHGGRVYLSGDDRDDDNVFISDLRRPFYYPVSLPIQLPPTSDKIVGMVVYDNSIVVGRTGDIYAIFGNTNRPDMGVEPYFLKRINTHTGFANNDAVSIVHNHLFFLGNDGNTYALGSTRVNEKELSTVITSKTIDILKSPINLTLDDIKTATAYFHQDMWYLSIKDKVLVFSYRNMAWTMWDGFNAKCFYVLGDKLIWGMKNGYVATFGEDYLDFGTPYQAFWYSKHFDMDDANSYKQFREFFIVAHTFNDYNSNINLLFEVDYADIKDSVSIENQISIWGKSKWGDRLINRNVNPSLPFVIGRRGRTIRFKFTNGYFVHGMVDTAIELESYVGRAEGVLVKVIDENAFYLYTGGSWTIMEKEDLNQRMKVYQINGDYEMRGKR